MYYIYILKSNKHKKTYVGMTNDIERRIKEHNKGRSVFTKKYCPWQLIYKEEFYTASSAREKEKYLKSRSGRTFLKLNIPR